jgi:hypothetical protein
LQKDAIQPTQLLRIWTPPVLQAFKQCGMCLLYYVASFPSGLTNILLSLGQPFALRAIF